MKKFIFVYKTTNLINNKFYIGKHATDILKDGYLGSGKALKKALKKYGKENFKIEILKFFKSEKEAFEYEKKLVTIDFVNNKNCYNLMIGGKGLTTEEAIRFNTSKYLIKYSKSKDGREKSRVKLTNLMKNEEMKEKARNNLRKINSNKDFIERRNKRIEEILIPYARSEEGRKAASDRLKKYVYSEKGRKHCSEQGKKIMSAFNKSERHHEVVVNSNKNRIISEKTKNKHSNNVKKFNKEHPEQAKRKQELATFARYYNILILIKDKILTKESFEKARNLCNIHPKAKPHWESLIKRFVSIENFVKEINNLFNESFTYENTKN